MIVSNYLVHAIELDMWKWVIKSHPYFPTDPVGVIGSRSYQQNYAGE